MNTTWIEITDICFSRLDNALHARLHRLLYQLICAGEPGVQALGISPELADEWARSIAQEEDINRQVRASVATEDLNKLKLERAALVRYVFHSIHSAASAPFGTMAQAGARLSLVVAPFARMQYESVDRQSSLTDSLLIDMAKPANAADVGVLQLGEAVARLEQTNEQYKQLRAQRTAQRAAQMMPRAVVVRPCSDDLCRMAFRYIQATHLLTPQAELRAQIRTLVNRIEQQAAEVVAAYRQGLSQKRAARKVLTPHSQSPGGSSAAAIDVHAK